VIHFVDGVARAVGQGEGLERHVGRQTADDDIKRARYVDDADVRDGQFAHESIGQRVVDQARTTGRHELRDIRLDRGDQRSAVHAATVIPHGHHREVLAWRSVRVTPHHGHVFTGHEGNDVRVDVAVTPVDRGHILAHPGLQRHVDLLGYGERDEHQVAGVEPLQRLDIQKQPGFDDQWRVTGDDVGLPCHRLAGCAFPDRDADREPAFRRVRVCAGDGKRVRRAVLTAARLKFRHDLVNSPVSPLDRRQEVGGGAVPVQIRERPHDLGELVFADDAQVARERQVERRIVDDSGCGPFSLGAVSRNGHAHRIATDLLVFVRAQHAEQVVRVLPDFALARIGAVAPVNYGPIIARRAVLIRIFEPCDARREFMALDIADIKRQHGQRLSRHLSHRDARIGQIESTRVWIPDEFRAVIRPDRLQKSIDECQSRVIAVLDELATRVDRRIGGVRCTGADQVGQAESRAAIVAQCRSESRDDILGIDGRMPADADVPRALIDGDRWQELAERVVVVNLNRFTPVRAIVVGVADEDVRVRAVDGRRIGVHHVGAAGVFAVAPVPGEVALRVDGPYRLRRNRQMRADVDARHEHRRAERR